MSISGNGKPDRKPAPPGVPPSPLKQGTGEGDEPVGGGPKLIRIPDPVVVRDLASALAQKPFKIIADLMELGVFVNVRGAVAFETASKVACKYGYKTEKIG